MVSITHSPQSPARIESRHGTGIGGQTFWSWQLTARCTEQAINKSAPCGEFGRPRHARPPRERHTLPDYVRFGHLLSCLFIGNGNQGAGESRSITSYDE